MTWAQSGAGVEPVTGGAGWVGAGLLGLVLGWLMLRHLPDKDRQIRQFLEFKDEQIKAMLQTKNEQLKSMIASQETVVKLMHEQNQKSLDQVIQHCKDETQVTGELLQHQLSQLTEVIGELRDEIRGRRRRQPPGPPQQ